MGSNDDIWADLLARNLSARGIATTRCDLSNLRDHIASVAEGSWIVLDGGWPMLELQSAVEDLNPLLSQPHINTVVVVDELVGPHPLSSLKPDTFISRSSDMRVFVRELLALFQSFITARPSTT